MWAFSESVRLFKAASQFDILGRVKSFGIDGVYRAPQIIGDAMASQFAGETGLIARMLCLLKAQ